MPMTAPVGGRAGGLVALLHHRDQEDRRSRSPPGAPRGTPSRPARWPNRWPERPAAAPSSSRFMVRACLPIQRIMNVTMTTANAPTTVSSPSCCLLRQLARERAPARCRWRGTARRRDHADPGRPQRVASTVAGEERRDDPDDETGFEAFAQSDHQRGDHGVGSSSCGFHGDVDAPSVEGRLT